MDKNNPVIKTKDLNVYYGENHVLKNINVQIPRNGVTSIIGPSGCGKTTLLKSFNRLVELVPESKMTGSITFEDHNINDAQVDVTELRKRIGMIGQTPSPLPMSIFDNVAFGLKIHLEKENIAEKVEQCLRLAGLWAEVKERLNEPAYRLSIGQQQRLSLARTLAVGPEVLLCDEPTSALDPISAKHVEEQLMFLKQDYSIIFVTHTLRQAKRISDYVLFMYLGEVIETGSADDIFHHPQDQRTKDYVEGVMG
jgi:phosphate transport system ATP-binding protein